MNAAGVVIDTATFGRGGSPESEVTAVTLRADVAGTIELSGAVAALHCPGPASEQLKTQFESIDLDVVASLGDALLGAGQTLRHGLPALLASAGIVPANATRAIFTVRRAGSTCAAALGITDDLLATVTLDFRNAPLQVSNLTYHTSCDAADVPAAFPLALKVVCAGLSLQARLEAADPNTITLSSDYAAAGNGLFTTAFDVTFPVAGHVTMTPNLAWVQSLSCPPDFSFENLMWSYFEPGRQPAGASQLVGSLHCYSAHDYPSNSFDVAAGTTVLFQVVQLNGAPGASAMTGQGTAFTIRLVPAP